MMWDDMGFLQFRVYHKEGQAIKYVDCSSCHRNHVHSSLLLWESTYNLVGCPPKQQKMERNN
eukprot:668035-Ditylum_brightwellii.AAC.1